MRRGREAREHGVSERERERERGSSSNKGRAERRQLVTNFHVRVATRNNRRQARKCRAVISRGSLSVKKI
jgi:hypothetical protein